MAAPLVSSKSTVSGRSPLASHAQRRWLELSPQAARRAQKRRGKVELSVLRLPSALTICSVMKAPPGSKRAPHLSRSEVELTLAAIAQGAQHDARVRAGGVLHV